MFLRYNYSGSPWIDSAEFPTKESFLDFAATLTLGRFRPTEMILVNGTLETYDALRVLLYTPQCYLMMNNILYGGLPYSRARYCRRYQWQNGGDSPNSGNNVT